MVAGHPFLTTQGMITLILATDMARHAEIMDAFKDKLESFDYSNEEHVTLVSGLLVPLWGAAEGAPPSSSAWEARCLTWPCSVVSIAWGCHQFPRGGPPGGALLSKLHSPSHSGLKGRGRGDSSCSGVLRIRGALPQ